VRSDARNETLPLVTEAPPEVAPVAVTESPKTDEVARAAIERSEELAHRALLTHPHRKSEPTAETREFWETWAEEKSTRSEQPPATVEVPAETASESGGEDKAERSDRGERSERGGRGRDRGRGGKDRGKRGDRDKRSAKEDRSSSKDEEKRPSKREAAAAPAAAASSDAQARLFVSLGKKHGVSADDLRSLLAAGTEGDKSKIGAISLRDSHAHVRVPEDAVDAIIAAVNGTQHNDQDVTVEPARA